MFFQHRLLTAGLALVAGILSSQPLAAQARPNTAFGLIKGQTQVFEVTVGYAFARANAPVGSCGCFGFNGGYGSLTVNAPHGFGMVADLSAVHANNINGSRQSATVFRYLFGPRYSFRTASRATTLYAQALGGGAQEFSNYAAVHDVSSPAVSLGGGLSRVLAPRLAWNVVEASWVRSWLPNGQNDLQNDLRLNTGVTFRFGPR